MIDIPFLTKAFIKRQAADVLAAEGQVAAARFLAKSVFRNMADRKGLPMFAHLEAVALDGATPDFVCIGYLHDLFEKFPKWTAKDLTDIGLNTFIVTGVQTMTNPGLRYFDYIVKNFSAHPEYIPVKKSDWKSNESLERAEPERVDYKNRMEKYALSEAFVDELAVRPELAFTPFSEWMKTLPPEKQNWVLLIDYSDCDVSKALITSHYAPA